MFSLQERVNTQTQNITLNTIENNSSQSREKLDDFIRDWQNDRNDIVNAINELKKEIRRASKEISNKLDNLNKLLRDLIDLINQKANEIKEIFEKNLNEIKNIIETKLVDINNSLNNINNELNKLNNILLELDKEIIKSIEKMFESLKQDLNVGIESVLSSITNFKAQVTEEFSIQFTLIEGTILGVIEAVNANLYLQLTWQTGNITASIEGLLFLFKTHIDAKIDFLNKNIKTYINNLEDSLKKFLEDNLKEYVKNAIDDWFNNKKEDLYKEITEEICCNIVGESYIKYDGENLYMPTLVFKYKNKNKQESKSYSQIKIRLNLKPDDITDIIVDNLRIKIQELSKFTYTSGDLRCVYISVLKKDYLKQLYLPNLKKILLIYLKKLFL